MKKKKLLLLNYFIGDQLYFESPIFFGNALYWLQAYLDTQPEVGEAFQVQIVNFQDMNYLNHGANIEENMAVLGAVLSPEPQIVAFSLYVWNVTHAHELASVIKQMAPEVLILAGGPEVNDRREFSSMFPAFDVLVEGDGEIPLKNTLLRLRDPSPDLAGIPNVSFRAGAEFVHNPSEAVFADMEAIPDFYAPNRSLIEGRGFYLTTRGCPYNCDMCLWAKQPMRSKSRERILQELHSLIDDTQLSFLTIFDYDLLEAYHADPDFFAAVAEMVRKKGDGFGINFFVNPKAMLDPRLPEMVTALNPHHIMVGLQSTSTDALRGINRGWSIGALDAFEKADPDLRALFHVELIFPLPDQTAAEFIESIKKLMGMGYIRLQIFQLGVLRGTSLYRKREELGLRYQSSPPYSCFATPLVSMKDGLRVGALSKVLNTLRFIADTVPDRRPFIHFFTEDGAAIDGILESIDQGLTHDQILRGLIKDIIGIEWDGNFGQEEYKRNGFDLSAAPKFSQDAADGEAPGHARSGLEDEIKEFLLSLNVGQVQIERKPDSLVLQIQLDGRKLAISLFSKKLERPFFAASRFYRVAHTGQSEDEALVEKLVEFIRQLERKAVSGTPTRPGEQS